jgi:hypothetical protein
MCKYPLLPLRIPRVANSSVRRKVLYRILIEFVVPMKLVRLIKMCLSEVYSKDHIFFFSYRK